MGKRLVPKTLVDKHEDQLRAAVTAAWTDQLVKVSVTLRSHGIAMPALTAAGAAAAVGHVAVPNVWSQSAWERNVNTHLAPVAQSVAQASVDAATSTVKIPSLWGHADSSEKTAQAIVDQALKTGAWIGQRLDAAAVRGPAPQPRAITAAGKKKVQAAGGASDEDEDDAADAAAADAVEDAMTFDLGSVLGTGGDILGDLISSMANTAATMASDDVTSYLASYVVSAEASPYLSATKSWENAGDDKVRDSHDGVDDVPINELFDVGGGMVGPGDPQGGDDEVANCRCWVEYEGVVPEGSGYEAGQAPQYQGEAYSEPDEEGEDA